MYTRTSSFSSRIIERELLTKPGSTKKTYHLVLDIAGTTFPFQVGDSVGVLPMNDPQEVERILDLLDSRGDESVFDRKSETFRPFREFLLYKTNLARINNPLLHRLVEKGAPYGSYFLGENRSQLMQLLQTHSLLDLLLPQSLSPQELADLAMPLMPRFYSIANSPKVYPHEIHLLVGYVEYVGESGTIRRGVGSHFLCDLAELEKTPIPIYVQPSHQFSLPSEDASIILVGPGTGIAPYRAFLQERLATQATGRNWILFGERHRATDFYYESFWTQLEEQGLIRLDLAFSRDQKEKIYVQHRMYEKRKSLWDWLKTGAYFYVCGDANNMAKDVDATLRQIVKEEGGLPEEEVNTYVKNMRAEKRYRIDVY